MSNANENQPADDSGLIARWKQGDPAAFDVLVEKYAGKAYQIAYGVLGNKEDAEEVAQDVFIRIHRALARFRGDAEFSTWMYRIALNLARNKYRWNKVRGLREMVSLDAPVEGEDGDSRGPLAVPAAEPSPDRHAAFKELEQNVAGELEALPDTFREALVLRNLEDMDYHQIASLLGCKLGTVKSRIARAREELRRRLNL
ncbi:MAG: sigma-70 family RNA polymerase sigma factor [Lentisphaeria bacterium]